MPLICIELKKTYVRINDYKDWPCEVQQTVFITLCNSNADYTVKASHFSGLMFVYAQQQWKASTTAVVDQMF